MFRDQLLGDGGGKGKTSKGSKDLDLSEKRYDDVCELLAFIDPRVDTNLTGRLLLHNLFSICWLKTCIIVLKKYLNLYML